MQLSHQAECCVFASGLCFLSNLVLAACNLPLNPAMINIGIIMLLIPGIALTNAIRDVFSGDTISGLLRFSEALVLSVTIAWGFTALASPNSLTAVIIPWVQLAAGIIGSMGFSLMFNVRGRRLFWCSLGGGVAWGAVLLCVLFWRKGIMGTEEFTWDKFVAFCKNPFKYFKRKGAKNNG